MIKETKITPPNSMLLITSRDIGEIPTSLGGEIVAATESCIAVGTLSEADGETAITLTNEQLQVKDANLKMIFSGILLTPSKVVTIYTALLKPVLALPAQKIETRVEIWANDEKEPDKLCIYIR